MRKAKHDIYPLRTRLATARGRSTSRTATSNPLRQRYLRAL